MHRLVFLINKEDELMADTKVKEEQEHETKTKDDEHLKKPTDEEIKPTDRQENEEKPLKKHDKDGGCCGG
ncbi:MAG: hypothetical protein IAF58_14105 [Leptolyngbya sp.]|nr:hypothetical protein [Candidatus Melainabacteria bacterium]